jgi:hypothetical protein
MRPIYLLADSQLLFWREKGRVFLERCLLDLDSDAPKAAYIGASNGDERQYFDIFEAAMESIGVRDRVMVRTDPTEQEMQSLREATLILLAGGDPVRGFRVMESNGVRDAVAERYYAGAILFGVSAGAVQLGLGMAAAGEGGSKPAILGRQVHRDLVNMFRFVPCLVDVHDEDGRWEKLSEAVGSIASTARGIGIPRGGGMIFHSEDNSIEPIRRPLEEISYSNGVVTKRLLFPETTPGNGPSARSTLDSDGRLQAEARSAGDGRTERSPQPERRACPEARSAAAVRSEPVERRTAARARSEGGT